MSEHADHGPGKICALDGQRGRGAHQLEMGTQEKGLPIYDATIFVGLRTIVLNAAIERIEEDGEVTIEVPKLDELAAAATVSRCLMNIKLRGAELRVMRKIMKMTIAELAEKLDGRTAPETISRWESEAQPMGGYAEKVFRLLVCETLKSAAPGVDYDASKIAHLNVIDPWRTDASYQAPAVVLQLVHLKEPCSGSIIEAWNAKQAA